MRWIGTVVAGICGLFVDDGSFAVAILVWLGLFWLLTHYIDLPKGAMGAILFAGLAAILVESATRRARR
jgi:hypothetical protein